MNDEFLHSMFSDLLGDLRDPQVLTHVLWQIATLVLVLAVTWVIRRALRANLRESIETAGVAAAPEFGAIHLSTVLAPFIAWLLLKGVAGLAVGFHERANLLRIAAVLLLASGILRLTTYTITRVFQPSGLLIVLQRIFAGLVFVVVALHVTGFLPDVLDALEIPIYKAGDMPKPLTLLDFLRDGFLILIALLLALWAGAVLDARLMKVGSIDASLRVALARFARAALLVLAVLVSMNTVGIPLGVLSVFGGALGVGLGLGLQRIASNYVSGFIILLDRSLRIGDLITVDKYHGAVTQIRTRYTVIKALDGTEAIIPNELLVSGAVTNHSYTSKELRMTVKVQIGYGCDLERALKLMVEAARAQSRVLTDPAPLATLSGFGADGLDLELGFWVPDPELGTGLTRSDISRAILSAFNEAGITIPGPQREVRLSVPEAVRLQASAAEESLMKQTVRSK
ncbi:MAG: mechanosensitive ion channel domain-containing protein [Burkholderiaceae bacterium]|jgi:small-conductance mechanosensitive channel